MIQPDTTNTNKMSMSFNIMGDIKTLTESKQNREDSQVKDIVSL